MIDFNKKTTLELVQTMQKIAKEVEERFEIAQKVPAPVEFNPMSPIPFKPFKVDVNAARKEVIEYAKGSLQRLSNPIYSNSRNFKYLVNSTITVSEVILNEKKRTVTVLLKGHITKNVISVGVAKCDPNDTFNIHIGTAIALYRAMKREVPNNLLTVANPTKPEVGDIIAFAETTTHQLNRYKVLTLDESENSKNVQLLIDHAGIDHSKTMIKAYGADFDWAKIVDDSKE